MKRFVILLAMLLLGVRGASAAIILQVDVSNPLAVVVSATGREADLFHEGLGTFDDGVYLWNFFSGSTSTVGSVSGNLTIGAQAVPAHFDSYYKGQYGSLNLYGREMADSLAFSLVDPAFIGSAVIDLSSFALELPSVGWVGEVIGWNGINTIGHYIVVPEPSLAVLGGLGLAAFSLLRLRSRRRA